MTGMTSGSLQPTYMGHVTTARDALKLFEACLRGHLHHVPRRPHDRERNQLIKSGCIFIYEENASGIKRWTDGVPWSPSRILGNFLVYRELVKPFPPGEKKRAQKRAKTNRAARASDPYPNQRRGSDDGPFSIPIRADSNGDGREGERALIGSLVDSYGFKDGGLVKKTMSVNVNGVHHHLVSYYSIDDVLTGKLQSPSKDKDLDDIEPRSDLVARQNFRAPIDDLDLSVQDPMGNFNAAAYGSAYGYDTYRAPPMMNMSHQYPHTSMAMYSTPAYTTAPAATTGYTTVSQSYYPTTTMSSPQAAYSQTYVTAPHAPLGMSNEAQAVAPPQHAYAYHRQNCPPPPHLPSRVGSIDSMTPTSDGKTSESDWHRQSQNGSYSSLTSPISAQSNYGPPPTQWAAPPLPSREDAWAGYATRTGPSKVGLHIPAHTGESAMGNCFAEN